MSWFYYFNFLTSLLIKFWLCCTAVKREMTASVGEPFQVIQLTEDTAYALMKECVQDTDGKWSFNYGNKIINFADNSVTPVSDIVSLSAFIH